MIKPTILIGQGRFGREVLQRLLSKTAPRGTLEWELAPRAGSGPGAHRLRDLALLCMPEGTALEAEPTAAVDGQSSVDGTGSRADFIVDLYRQIREVEHRPGNAEEALCDAVSAAADGLLQPQTVLRRGGGLAGLDVIVIAHVDGPGVLSTIDSLTRALLKRLVIDNPSWKVTVASERKLNCIHLLDFDNYRHPEASGRAIRRALRRSMDTWKQQLDAKRPAIDRCWLLDGRANGPPRDRETRREEITLFLELLLFSQLRSDAALSALYQQGSQNQQIAAAFGIRLLERNPRLLSRVAAARFGEGWLPYLRGGKPVGFHRPARRVAEALEPLLAAEPHPEATNPAAGDGSATEPMSALRRTLEDGLDRLREQLLALPERDADDWAERARVLYAEQARKLELELGRTGLEQVRRVRETRLRDDGRAIERAVTEDLHDPLEPVPLASVVNEIDEAIRRLSLPAAAPALAVSAAPSLEWASAAHRDYLAQRGEWISRHGRGLALFWPLLALVAALSATPLLQDLIRQLPLLAWRSLDWQDRLTDLAAVLAQPPLTALMAFLLLWLGLRLTAQPGIGRAIRRAGAFFLDAERGRISDAIEADCARLQQSLDQVQNNVRATLSADVLLVLGSIRDRLKRRDREILWLRKQLGEFMRMQGLDADTRHLSDEDGVHRLVQGEDDLHRMLGARPVNDQQFQVHQDDMPEPFTDWTEPYCDTFLDLFSFVDRLSRTYLIGFQNSVSTEPDGPEWKLRRQAMQAFVKPPVGAGFRIDADQARSQPDTYCVLPRIWDEQPEMRKLLQGIAVTEERIRHGADDARVYLLTTHLNIPPDALETG